MKRFFKSKTMTNALLKLGLYGFSAYTKPDIYHPTYYDDYNIPNAKKVITIHDMVHELFFDDFDDKERMVVEKKRKIAASASGIIAISESTKNDIVRLYDVSPDKIKVIYHANSLNIDVNNERIIKEPYILYVGSRWGYKNFADFLQAFANSQYKHDLYVVCFGGGDFNKNEAELIYKLGLDNRVLHKGGDDKILANLYQYATAFFYPSKYEGFGLPPLEAMHYGAPVAVSKCSSIPEVVDDAGLYFNPNSVDDMTDKINEILSDESLRKTLTAKGYLQEKKFSWETSAQEHINYYKEILES